jgi:hypothetical protein
LETGSPFLPMSAWTLILFYVSHCSWNDGHAAPYLAFFIEMGYHKFFLPWLASTRILLIWASHIAWHGRCMPPCPAIGWDGVSRTICPEPWSFPISASQVARIIGMSHLHLAHYVFKNHLN